MGVSAQSSASSALRMAATRPSIMSLGATTSAPALARLTAVRASRLSEGSFFRSGAILGIERAADGGDSAVHHVAGGHDVGPGFGKAYGGAGEQVERRVVFHFEAMRSEERRV